jgi:hypothetical protein
MSMRYIKNIYTTDSGQSDYLAEATCNFVTGQSPFPVTSSRYLALFTAAPTSDAGTGGTEVSGGAYARVQIAGQLTAGAAISASSSLITLSASAPAWLVALGTNGSNVNVYDATASILTNLGTVSTIATSVVTLTASAAHAGSGAADTLAFSAFPTASASSGTEPSVTPVTVTNSAVITFPAATASWGTVVAFGIYDAATSGNLEMWDYIGNYNWIPCAVSSQSTQAVFTSHAHGYSSGTSIVVTSKYGGTIPTASTGSFTGILTVSSVTTDTFYTISGSTTNATSTSGDLMTRALVQQSIPSGVTASFAASTLTLNVA